MAKINWRYAFGEILIVIIGITIAFSLNNWAENSKEKSQREQYLVNLKNDIETDRQRLEEIVAALERKIETSGRVLSTLGTEAQNSQDFVGDVFSIANVESFSAKDITYRTLINSGDLKLIDDFELKAAIETHYSNYTIMMKDFERQENIHKEYLGDYFINHTNFDDFRNGIFGFKDERLLKNIVQSMQGSFRIKLEATKKGIESCDSKIAILSEHIN